MENIGLSAEVEAGLAQEKCRGRGHRVKYKDREQGLSAEVEGVGSRAEVEASLAQEKRTGHFLGQEQR